jgi:hypothetical protein
LLLENASDRRESREEEDQAHQQEKSLKIQKKGWRQGEEGGLGRVWWFRMIPLDGKAGESVLAGMRRKTDEG